MIKQLNIRSIEIDGINKKDYPDFVDAYASYAEWSDGEPLTDDELAAIPDYLIQELALERSV